MNKKTALSLLFSSLVLGLNAQQSTNATGSNSQSANGSVSYSVGQVFYETNTSVTGNTAQGVQQPIEIYILDLNANSLEIDITVFPNPTSDQIIIDMKELNLANVRYELIDLQGKKLQSNQINYSTYQVELETYPQATYLLTILQEDQPIKSFRIIKN